MIPTVRGVTSASSSVVSRLKLARSMSQNTGVAPMYSTTFAVATQVNDGTITVANGVGRNATILDDQTVSLAATTTNDIVAGEIEAVDATLGVLVAIGL